MPHDIFISYRREGGFETAYYLHEHLERDGYSVTFDIDALRSGRFDNALLSRIDECTDFIVILSRGCFDRSIDPSWPPENDWLRRELSYALQKKKNVIPILLGGFTSFPTNLPDDIKDVQLMNGPTYVPQYIDEFYRTLKTRFLKTPSPFHESDESKQPEPAHTSTPGEEDVPELGKSVSDLSLTTLTGDDAKHFSAAMAHCRVLLRRSALRELDSIEKADDPIVRYYSLMLRYEVDGGSDAELESACAVARDLGCTDAMNAFADRHLTLAEEGVDSVGKAECIAWLRRAIEKGNPDALATLGGAYEDGKGVPKNPSLARSLYAKSAAADSMMGRMALGFYHLYGHGSGKDPLEAAKVLRPLVFHLQKHEEELGPLELCLLAMCFSTDEIFEKKPELAVRYSERAIDCKGKLWGVKDQFQAYSYMILGMLLLAGDGIEHDEHRAFECFLHAQQIYPGDGTAAFQLANCYENGFGVEPDAAKAKELIREAANRGNSAAQTRLAIEYLDDGPGQNLARGRSLLREAAEGGGEDAQMLLGRFLLTGYRFDVDVVAGKKWLETAVESGSAEAMNYLGELYRDGADGIDSNPETAVQWFRRGAEAGSTEAMENLGVSLLAGNGIRRDVKEAETWLRKSAEQGNASAECSLGTRFYNGDFGEKNPAEAVAWWEKAAEDGDTTAMNNLSQYYQNPLNGEPDLEKAEKWLVKAAESGDADAACSLGASFYRGDFGEPDKRKALEWSRKGAALGDLVAMNNLGIMFRDGDGVEKDSAIAADWFRRAAEAGHPQAMTSFGLALLFGDGVPTDEKAGTEWLEKAFESGDPDGAFVLGVFYSNNGDGDDAKQKAVEWWTKAAEQGNPAAMHRLFLAYRAGYGVETDLRTAIEWLQKSAEGGEPDAMGDLGLAYLQGEGMTIDEKKAEEWLVRAAENGSSSAECSLGTRFAHGDFGKKDMAEAIRWWEKAAEHGDATAMTNLGIVFSDGQAPVDLEKARKYFSNASEAGNERASYYIAIDSLGFLDSIPETYDDWIKQPVAGEMEPEQALRLLRKARSWFSRPVETNSNDSDLMGACLLWLARIARLTGDEKEAESLYEQSAQFGNAAAAAELRSMSSALFRIKDRICSALGFS